MANMILDNVNGITFPDGSVQAKAAGLVAFSAYQNAGQSFSASAEVKVVFQAVEANYPNVGFSVGATSVDNLSRFQPTIAGYYDIKGSCRFPTSTANAEMIIRVYKNSSVYKTLNDDVQSAFERNVSGSCLVYLNGSSDYIELFGLTSIAVTTTANDPANTYFQGILVAKA
jgi:hypothetical protein